MYKTRHKTACMHACLCLCTCTHKHVHTLCSLDPCGTLQPGMLRTSYLGEFREHQLWHQLVGGSAWFPSALLGSPRGWTHGPSAIRAQTSLAMENFGSGYRRSREGPSSVAVMETTSCGPGEHTVSMAPFPMFAVFGDFNVFP